MEKDVAHIYSEILRSRLQGWNGAICSNTDAPRDDHTKWSKSERERQGPHDTAHMQNQKYDTNEPIYDTGFLLAQTVTSLPLRQEICVRSLVGKIPWGRKWQPTPVFLLPGKPHGWGNLIGHSPWGHKDLDKTEKLTFRSRITDTGNRLVAAGAGAWGTDGGGGWGWQRWAVTHRMGNEVLLHSTGIGTQYLMMSIMEKGIVQNSVCVCVCVCV